MHTLNPFNSRSYNAKVTNWRVLQLRGLKAALKHLLPTDAHAHLNEQKIDEEIEVVKKTYSDYLRVQFGEVHGATCPHCNEGVLQYVRAALPYSLKHLQCNNCDSTYNL